MCTQSIVMPHQYRLGGEKCMRDEGECDKKQMVDDED